MIANTNPTTSSFHGADVPDYGFIVNCMHCGLCLPHCPTYALTNQEKSSPRGRIRLIKSVADGDLPITQGFVDEMNFCLDCQACETACPAGVKYGSLVESARAQIFQQGHESTFSTLTKKFILGWVFSQPTRIRILARLLKFYDDFGIKWFLKKTGILRLFSDSLHEIQELAPTISDRPSSQRYPEIVQPYGEKRFTVGFLAGCIMDVAYADVNTDTIELLRAHGCEVVMPHTQVCCGSLQAHNGDRETARELARKNVEAFSKFNIDAIVMNSAGCGAFMKDYGHVFQDDPLLTAPAVDLSSKVRDVTEFLHEIRFKTAGEYFRDKRVTYHDACHLVHTQKISRQPRELIKAARGVEFVELPESTWCCGSAGIYNITRYDDSMRLLARKLEHVRSIRPDIIVTGNPGCLAQIQYGLLKEGMNIELMHTATFLRRASEA
ncbi:MAG: (Fe-S)-binding protein [Ignavibacteriae bacterium]|nr:(Fe-S)-binding protein [Ignavibacteriota bacterium]